MSGRPTRPRPLWEAAVAHDSFYCGGTAFIVGNQFMLRINKLCHKSSWIPRPSGGADPGEERIKVVTKHNLSKILGLFRLIKVVTTVKVVTAKVQPKKNHKDISCKNPGKIMMVSLYTEVIGTSFSCSQVLSLSHAPSSLCQHTVLDRALQSGWKRFSAARRNKQRASTASS